MIMRKSTLLTTAIACTLAINAWGQNALDGRRNVITTAVPFLTITPDSRSGAMGDAGVAMDPSANSMHWNPAAMAYVQNPFGLSVSYTPWLKSLVNDISLSYLSGYYRIDEMSAVGGSLRYFSLGNITFTNQDNVVLIEDFNPSEFALDAGYARKLSDNFSVGIALRFIYSNLTGGISAGSSATRPGMSGAGDASLYYRKPNATIGGKNARWSIGLNISNMGAKISYVQDADADFIPTNLKLGAYFSVDLDDYNTLGFALDLNKLLVPTMPVIALGNGGGVDIVSGYNPDVGVPLGMVQSFYDAPGDYDSTAGAWRISPFQEELREINPSIGLEYWYKKTFAVRAGYFYEHPTKGNRQYATAGVGLRYNTLTLDFSYLVPLYLSTNGSTGTSPLANTVRFTLNFNFNQNIEGATE